MQIIQINDYDEIFQAYTILKDTFPDLEDRVDISEYINKLAQHAEVFVLMSNEEVCGLAAMYANNTITRIAYITLIGVAKSLKRQGIGTILFNHCLEYARKNKMEKMLLEVNKSNNSAILFYTNRGMNIAKDASESSYYMEMKI